MTTFSVGVEGDLLTVRLEMAEVAKELNRQVDQWREAAERTRQQWEESEWFLGEARATIARLEAQSQVHEEAYAQLERIHQDTTTQLQEAERQRDDATQAQEELQRIREELLRQTAHLTDLLAQARGKIAATQRSAENSNGDLDVEHTRHEPTEAELLATGTNGERRRASRARRPDITVELQRHDGTVLFHGPLRDLSRTGMGFASDRLADGAPDLLWVTLHPEGAEHPIEAVARLAWLRQEDGSGSYAGGCELIDIPPGSRGAFEEVLGHSS